MSAAALLVAALATAAPAAPDATETVQRALRHFQVSGDRVSTLRALARARGLLPRVVGSFARDDGDGTLDSRTTGDQNLQQTDALTNGNQLLSVSVEWDFRDLMFNNNEVQVYSLVSLQRDLILEVSRTYYLREQLIVQRETDPPTDARAARVLDLRIREFTTLLDVFTGGWFTAELTKEATP